MSRRHSAHGASRSPLHKRNGCTVRRRVFLNCGPDIGTHPRWAMMIVDAGKNQPPEWPIAGVQEGDS